MSRWIINRVGLLNFWYYQNQIFHLAEGRMLLRGTNGSGKSLTMQSLFPVLFDGDTSAYRLDSFGSRDRKMEDYLLGEKGVSNRDEGIGYLFLEVKRDDREEYLTVGIGMHANRGGKLTKWFFTIENNQRIGIDFELLEELRKEEYTPLTKAKLKNRLEGVGRLFNTQREYKQFVNNRIFGFHELEQFDELIALLINLRSPKLSKDFRPSVIYGILRDSLPKLKDDDLLTLSKTIEQIDGHRERLEDLGNELKELNRFTKVYQRWQDEFVGQLAGKWLDSSTAKKRFTRLHQQNEEQRKQLEGQRIQQRAASAENEFQLEIVEEKIQSLSQHKGINLVFRGQELKEQLEQIIIRLEKEQNIVRKKQQLLSQQRKELEHHKLENHHYTTELEGLLQDNEQYLSQLRLEELDAIYSDKMRNTLAKEEYDYWEQQIKRKKSHLQQVKNELFQMDLLQQRLKDLKREAGDIQQAIDELEKDARHWQQIRQNEIEKWKQDFDEWYQGAPFELDEQIYHQLLYGVDGLLEEEIREEVLLEPLGTGYQKALVILQEEQIPLDLQLKNLQELRKEKETQIKEWRMKKIPEPDRRELRKQNRNQLAETHSFISFYQSVDFREEVSSADRNVLEGALQASGILDSLISGEGLSLAGDLQILPKPKFFSQTLADFLKVDPSVDATLQPIIADVLQSIIVDERNEKLPSVFRDGSYQIANLKGEMDPDYQASYIGAASQELFRQRKIREQEADMERLDQEKEMVFQAIVKKKQQRERMEEAYQKRPSLSEIYEAATEMRKVSVQREIRLEEQLKKSRQVEKMDNRVKEKKNDLLRMTQNDGLHFETAVYEEALLYAENYSANMADAFRFYNLIQGKSEVILHMKENISIQEEEEDRVSQSLQDLKIDRTKLQRLVEDNLDQQKVLHTEELQAQLSNAKQEQRERKTVQKEINQNLIELEKAGTTNEIELSRGLQELERFTYQENQWRHLLEKEAYHLFGADQAMEDFAKEAHRETSIKKLKDLESTVIQNFNYVADQLQKYQPQLMNVTVVELSEEEEQKTEDYANYNHYKYPRFRSEGQSWSVFDLLEQLNHQKMTLQDLLKVEDEKLFKTIILESVGNILRVRIQQGMQWIDQMNQLLKAQKNSSGLSLSIQWKGIPSASEQDLGTNRLVELLQKPTSILSTADQEAISLHFQEKVRFAQEQVQINQEERSTLFQAIAKALDYRDWFEFELKFKRANEGYAVQTLTDRRFNQFSGGEKAVAMYLPLFTAVHSRYGEAGTFCPRVITLDEAFAGIDDANISELFKACEELEFNYVMNSQALFGDYPTVSQLMIYELLRPQNMNLVTAIRYYWNGRKKEMILEGAV